MDKLRSARPTSDNGTSKVEVHSFLFKTDGDWMSDDTDGSDDNKDADGSDDNKDADESDDNNDT